MGTAGDSSVSRAINRCSGDEDISATENAILAAAAATATLTPFLALIMWLITKSFVAVLRCFSKNSMWAAVLNSILWAVFTVSSTEKVDNIELVVAYPVILTTAYIYLVIHYGDGRKIWQAVVLSTAVVLCLIYLFVALRFPIVLPSLWHNVIGIGGIGIFMWSHLCIFLDITEFKSLLDMGIGFLNILPNTFVNAASLYIILKNERHNMIVMGSCAVGSILGVAELMWMVQWGFHKNWYRAPTPPNAGSNGGDDQNHHENSHNIGACDDGNTRVVDPEGTPAVQSENQSSTTDATGQTNLSTHPPRVSIVATLNADDEIEGSESLDGHPTGPATQSVPSVGIPNLNGGGGEIKSATESTADQSREANGNELPVESKPPVESKKCPPVVESQACKGKIKSLFSFHKVSKETNVC